MPCFPIPHKSLVLITMAQSRNNLLSLSTELYMQIFSYLDPIHATCLGLASRKLYAIYVVLHRKLPLDSFTYDCPIPSTNLHTLCFLYTHLENWKPSYLSLCGGCHKFCRPNKSNGVLPPRERCRGCSRQELGQHSPGWQLNETRRLQGMDPTRLPQYGSSVVYDRVTYSGRILPPTGDRYPPHP
jgi:hypothetical protein